MSRRLSDDGRMLLSLAVNPSRGLVQQVMESESTPVVSEGIWRTKEKTKLTSHSSLDLRRISKIPSLNIDERWLTDEPRLNNVNTTNA